MYIENLVKTIQSSESCNLAAFQKKNLFTIFSFSITSIYKISLTIPSKRSVIYIRPQKLIEINYYFCQVPPYLPKLLNLVKKVIDLRLMSGKRMRRKHGTV